MIVQEQRNGMKQGPGTQTWLACFRQHSPDAGLCFICRTLGPSTEPDTPREHLSTFVALTPGGCGGPLRQRGPPLSKTPINARACPASRSQTSWVEELFQKMPNHHGPSERQQRTGCAFNHSLKHRTCLRVISLHTFGL